LPSPRSQKIVLETSLSDFNPSSLIAGAEKIQI
jgi:hypothetical protein